MCINCGCGSTNEHSHNHEHEHSHNHEHGSLTVNLERAILEENNKFAQDNRNFFKAKNILALNILSSPGSGKTTLLEQTIIALRQTQLSIYVIEGDQHTDLDTKRIREAGALAFQINTGKTCHLDAHMVLHAYQSLQIKQHSLLFIENVGNLICPALFDLGELLTVVMLSVTEGEDKPLKYPDMFLAADIILINKIDLLGYVPFNLANCINNIQRINSHAKIIEISAYTSGGITQWIELIKAHCTEFHILA